MIKRKFTKEEDSKICQLVKQYGAKKWDEIARHIPGRTGRQCRDRYQNYLHPGFFNGEWTNEEDELLYEKFNLMPNKWSKIVQFFPRRSANSLKNRWHYFVSRNYKNIKDKQNCEKCPNQNVIQYQIQQHSFLLNIVICASLKSFKSFIKNGKKVNIN